MGTSASQACMLPLSDGDPSPDYIEPMKPSQVHLGSGLSAETSSHSPGLVRGQSFASPSPLRAVSWRSGWLNPDLLQAKHASRHDGSPSPSCCPPSGDVPKCASHFAHNIFHTLGPGWGKTQRHLRSLDESQDLAIAQVPFSNGNYSQMTL